jgi:hypothetical protein
MARGVVELSSYFLNFILTLHSGTLNLNELRVGINPLCPPSQGDGYSALITLELLNLKEMGS